MGLGYVPKHEERFKDRKYRIYDKGWTDVSRRKYIIIHIRRYKALRKKFIDCKLGLIKSKHKWELKPSFYKTPMRENLKNIGWALEERRWHKFSRLIKKMMRDLERA
jgi:hypothetical protein